MKTYYILKCKYIKENEKKNNELNANKTIKL